MPRAFYYFILFLFTLAPPLPYFRVPSEDCFLFFLFCVRSWSPATLLQIAVLHFETGEWAPNVGRGPAVDTVFILL